MASLSYESSISTRGDLNKADGSSHLGGELHGQEARIQVDDPGERARVAIAECLGDLPRGEVADDAIRSLRRRGVAELGLSLENNHDGSFGEVTVSQQMSDG